MEINWKLLDFIDRKVKLDLADNVLCEVYKTADKRKYIVAVYDRRQYKPTSCSWTCLQHEAYNKLAEIQNLYGKEVCV